HRFARPADESRRAARNPYIASAARNPYIAGHDDRKGRHYYTRIGHRFARPADESRRAARNPYIVVTTARVVTTIHELDIASLVLPMSPCERSEKMLFLP